MVLGHGPDFKARTDLVEREEKARIESKKQKQAPERLDFRSKSWKSDGVDTSSGLLTRIWQRLRN